MRIALLLLCSVVGFAQSNQVSVSFGACPSGTQVYPDLPAAEAAIAACITTVQVLAVVEEYVPGLIPPQSPQARLNWTDSVTAGVVGYNVYRSEQQGGPYERLNMTPVPQNMGTLAKYRDTAITPGQRYFYVARALASDGETESPASNEATLEVPD